MAVLEIALSTRRACVLQMQSRRYLSPLLTKNFYCMSQGFCKSASQVVNILSCSLFTTCLAGVGPSHTWENVVDLQCQW